jgi:hypothetical protein
MSYFAEVLTFTDGKGIVNDVIAADQEFIDSGAEGDASLWWQTSYNTHGNVHYGQDGQPDGGVALRANYAGIGYTYDSQRDAFIAPKPFPSWILDEETCLWNPSVPKPNDGKLYLWDEENLTWVEDV